MCLRPKIFFQTNQFFKCLNAFYLLTVKNMKTPTDIRVSQYMCHIICVIRELLTGVPLGLISKYLNKKTTYCNRK